MIAKISVGFITGRSSLHMLKNIFYRLSSRIVAAWQRPNYGNIGVGKACAAIFGALLLSLCINLSMSIMLPIATNNRLALASILTIPIWIALAFFCIQARNAWQAWAKMLGGSLVLAIVIILFEV